MNKALSVVLIVAAAAGIIPLARSIPVARSIEASSHFMARRVGTWFRVESAPDHETHPAECPNVRHTPLYGI